MFLIQRALQRAHIPCALQILRNGQEAIQFFDAADVDRAQPCPHLVILDVNLPKRLGRDVLKHMRQTQRCANAQVIIVTTSDSPHDREQMERLGANGYFKKPSDFDEFMKLGEIVKSVLRAGSN